MWLKESVIPFIACCVLGLVGVLGYRWYIVQKSAMDPFEPQPLLETIPPPRQALTGRLTNIIGEVKYLSRQATATALITSETTLFQGESVAVDATSSVKIMLPSVGEVNVLTNGEVTLSNAAPTSLLFVQTGGRVTYSASNSAVPISIRSLHLLVTLASGSATISVHEPVGSIRLQIGNEPITVGYQDKNQKTFVTTLAPNSTALFNDAIRRLRLVTP